MFDLFNALVALGEDFQVATAIDRACKEHWVTDDAKKRIAQCCARGFVDFEDFRAIVEEAPGLVADPARADKKMNPHLLWADFVTEINLPTKFCPACKRPLPAPQEWDSAPFDGQKPSCACCGRPWVVQSFLEDNK